MTIELFSGTPGSGKSLHATSLIRDYLKYKKLPVIANYDLNVDTDLFLYVENMSMNPALLVEKAQEYWKDHKFKEDNILLVIDECQLLFNSRDWARRDRMGWLEFFSQHRKYGYRIIFIAQFDRMVDRQIRALIEYEHIHRKMGNLGKGGKLFKLLSFGELFVDVTKYYPISQKVSTNFFRYSKKISEMYNSYATFSHEQNSAADDARREGAEGGTLRRAAADAEFGRGEKVA